MTKKIQKQDQTNFKNENQVDEIVKIQKSLDAGISIKKKKQKKSRDNVKEK